MVISSRSYGKSQEQSRTEVFWPSGLWGNCWILAPQGEAPQAGTVPAASWMLMPCCCASPSHLSLATTFLSRPWSIWVFPQVSATLLQISLTQARTPPGLRSALLQSWQSSLSSARSDTGSLLLMHELEQPPRPFPRARSLSFAPVPLGQYHCKGKKCWNKHYFKRMKHRENAFLLEPREVQSGHGTRRGHRAGSSVTSQHDTGQLWHFCTGELPPKAYYISYLHTYIYIYISTSFAHSCQLTAHPSGLTLSDVLNTTAKTSFNNKGKWEDGTGRIFYPRERKRTKLTKFMSSTENKPTNTVCVPPKTESN